MSAGKGFKYSYTVTVCSQTLSLGKPVCFVREVLDLTVGDSCIVWGLLYNLTFLSLLVQQIWGFPRSFLSIF